MNTNKIVGVICALSLIAIMANADGRQFLASMQSGVTLDSAADSLPGGFIKTSSGAVEFVDEVVDRRNSVDVRSLNGFVILRASSTTGSGFGLADTGVIYIKTSGLGFPQTILDSIRMAIPCSLSVGLANVNDTLFKRHISVFWEAYDTSGGRTAIGTVSPYTIDLELIGRD